MEQHPARLIGKARRLLLQICKEVAKMKKKALSAFLAVCMTLTLVAGFTLPAAAAGTVSSASIETAISYAYNQKNTNADYWRQYCAAFVWACYYRGAGIGNSSYATAREMGDALITHQDANPPRGAFVFWYKSSDPYGAAGHVGLALGDGNVIHAFASVTVTSINYVNNCGYTYRGWGAPIAGYTLATETGSASAAAPVLSISGATAPTALNVGQIFSLYGTVSTSSGSITSLTGSILTSDGTVVQTKTVAPYTAAYNIHGIIDNNMEFNRLSTGHYIYRITATAVNGDKSDTKTLVDQAFTVGSPAPLYATPDVSFSPHSVTLDLNGTKSATLSVKYTGNTAKGYYLHCENSNCGAVNWQWSGTDVVVRAVAAGTCRMTISILENETNRFLDSDTCDVTVVNSAPQYETPAISLSPESVSLDLNGAKTASLKVTYTQNTGRQTFLGVRVSDNTVVKCSGSGDTLNISALKAGSATITVCLVEDNTAQTVLACADCRVTVTSSAPTYPNGFVYFTDKYNYRGQFTDVRSGQWYTDNVAAAYRLGLMKGNSETLFNSRGNVTVAEAITMAARIHSIFYTGGEYFMQTGVKWYAVYVNYALANGIINREYTDTELMRAATRAEFAQIFAAALPDDAMPEINQITQGAIPDVSGSEEYGAAVYKLYRAGVLTGSDSYGRFLPQTGISRVEAAAIVTRMANPSLRQAFTL